MWFLQPGITMLDVVMRILAALSIIFLILPIHEYAHGIVAYKLGDKTAKSSGLLTLNPLLHFDPLGAFSVIFFDIGWAKPIPIDPRNFKKPKRDMALVALAGPLSNIISAIAGALLLNLIVVFSGGSPVGFVSAIQKFLSYYIIINISITAFNFLPIPSLDGYKVIECLIPDKYLFKYYRYYPVILFAILGLILLGFFDPIIMFIRVVVYSFVIKIGSLPFMGLI